MKLLSSLFLLLWTGLASAADSSYTETAIILHTATGDIHGSLMMPGGKSKMPVALIIAGSGPTDRDGNTILIKGKNNSLLYIAQALAAKGIASLRYDKRGIGESAAAMGKEGDLRFDDYIEDAREWIAQLRADKRFGKLIVIGHSEGSLIGMVAAQAADDFVSIAGAGFPADEILKKQLANMQPAIRDAAYAALDTLKQGNLLKRPPILLLSIFRPSIQPYMISWLRHDPRKEIALLKKPVLLLQGDNDLQISTGDVMALKAAAPKSKMVIIPGMNHVLKLVAAGDNDANQKAYGDPLLPIAQKLEENIIVFIRSTGN
jgi:alpha-beta hydrolase superfamily lysophospholipase